MYRFFIYLLNFTWSTELMRIFWPDGKFMIFWMFSFAIDDCIMRWTPWKINLYVNDRSVRVFEQLCKLTTWQKIRVQTLDLFFSVNLEIWYWDKQIPARFIEVLLRCVKLFILQRYFKRCSCTCVILSSKSDYFETEKKLILKMALIFFTNFFCVPHFIFFRIFLVY